MAMEPEMNPTPLLTCADDEYDSRLLKMSIKDLVVTISALQNEMSTQQSRFDELGTQLAHLNDPNTDEGCRLSEEMLQCQGQLSQLMARNVKCFSLQAANENKQLLAGLQDNSTELGVHLDANDTRNLAGNKSVVHSHPLQNGATLVDVTTETNSHQPTKSPLESVSKQTSVNINKSASVDICDSDPDVITESKVVKHTTFVVRSGSNMATNEAPSGGASDEKINFSSARSMFEGSGGTSKVGGASRKFSVPANAKLVSSQSPPVNPPADKELMPQQDAGGISKTSIVNTSKQDTGAVSKAPPAADSHVDETDIAPRRKSVHAAIPQPNSNGAQKSAKAAPWQQQLKKLARNDFSVAKSSQSMNNMPVGKSGHSGPVKVIPKSASSHGEMSTSQPQPVTTAKAPQVNAPWKSQTSVQPASKVTNNTAPKAGAGIPHSNGVAVTQRSIGTVDTPKQTDKTGGMVKENGVAQGVNKTDAGHAGARQPATSAPTNTPPHPAVVQLSHSAITASVVHSETDRIYRPASPGSSTSSVSSSVSGVGVDDKQPVRASKRVAALYMSEKQHGHGDMDPDEKVHDRITLKDWDPTKLLSELYEVKLIPDDSASTSYISIEGYLEKLPLNKRKATLLKTWKRRYFKLSQGSLYYYEIEEDSQIADPVGDQEEQADASDDACADTDSASGYFQLMGGKVEDIGGRMLGLDDGRGRYMVVRCPTDSDTERWQRALESNTEDNISARWVKPVLTCPPSTTQKVVMVDLGSCSVRAGVLGQQASLPQVFFPTLAAKSRSQPHVEFGFEALSPSVRGHSNLVYPVRPSAKVDKFSIDMDLMPGLFSKIFSQLKINPSQHWMMFSAPAQISDKLKELFMDLFINKFNMLGANIQSQSLLSLYSYNATSGIVVDIGERMEILPVTQGYVVEGGITRQPYGGQRVTEVLNTSFTERRYRFFSDVENLLVRLAVEKMCFVSKNYKEDIQAYAEQSSVFNKSLSLAPYNLPPDTYRTLDNDLGLFRSPEGLFDLHLWGMDNPPLHKLVQKAILACPMDVRREMYRSIYLSGGITTLPGFQERLQTELTKLVPDSITVQVHGSPQRYHAAYLGASTMAGMNAFQQACISADEWRTGGTKTLRKWHLY